MNVVTRSRVVTGSNFSSSPFSPLQMRFASKKQGGKSKNGRDSNPKYLGMKVGSGQPIHAGNILCRQKGSKWHAGEGCGLGRDFTVYALKSGWVEFVRKRVKLRHLSKSIERKYITIKDYNPNVPPEQDIR